MYSEKLGESYAQAASILAKKNQTHEKTMVVFGEVVLDEISPIDTQKHGQLIKAVKSNVIEYHLKILGYQNMIYPQ